MAELKKCAHPTCNCIAPEGEKYCSQYCQDAGGTLELSCNCNHPGCALEAEVAVPPPTARVA